MEAEHGFLLIALACLILSKLDRDDLVWKILAIFWMALGVYETLS